MSYYPQCLERG